MRSKRERKKKKKNSVLDFVCMTTDRSMEVGTSPPVLHTFRLKARRGEGNITKERRSKERNKKSISASKEILRKKD